MKKPFVDLHVHSYYSDGSMSPEEIVLDAVSNEVGLLAIADHDVLEGSEKLKDLCKDNDIHYIPAVEIDTAEEDNNIHILAYGFDMNDLTFRDFVKSTRFCLDEMSVKVVQKMANDYSSLSLEEFFSYSYDKRLGGWGALHYLMEKGLSSSLKEGIRFYSEYDITYSKAGFSTVAATAHRIRAAGGYAILAHPGEVLYTSDEDLFKEEVLKLVSYGLDGIECYYPTHTEVISKICLDICNEYGLMITGGSDCHGVFGRARVGERNIKQEQLNLKDLLERNFY